MVWPHWFQIIFPSYARIFHPARTIDDEPVTWSAVSRANGRLAHPAMEWGSIVGSWHAGGQEGIWHEPPIQGSLPTNTTRALADTLRRFTQALAECRFGHWEGSGYVDLPSNELHCRCRLEMWCSSQAVSASPTQSSVPALSFPLE